MKTIFLLIMICIACNCKAQDVSVPESMVKIGEIRMSNDSSLLEIFDGRAWRRTVQVGIQESKCDTIRSIEYIITRNIFGSHKETKVPGLLFKRNHFYYLNGVTQAYVTYIKFKGDGNIFSFNKKDQNVTR